MNAALPLKEHTVYFPHCRSPAWTKRATTGTWTDDNSFYLFKLLLHFPFTFENRVVSFATLLLGSFQRAGGGGKSEVTQEKHSNVPPSLCCPSFTVSPSLTRRRHSAHLARMSAPERVILKTHEGSYIYGINDTLRPPHNSCLLHFS